METYYEILGLTPRATQKEIKRAYFRMIRKHSPESDPKMFVKLRRAYEELCRYGGEQRGPVYPVMDDPFRKVFSDTILDNFDRKRYSQMLNVCEEAFEQFPDEERFLYYLTVAARMNGNSGKSAEYAGRLTEQYPNNKWYQRELVFAYKQRGWKKKALLEADKAEQMGCDDAAFFALYSQILIENGRIKEGGRILENLLASDQKLSDDDLLSVVDALCSFLEVYKIGENYYGKYPVRKSINADLTGCLKAAERFVKKQGARLYPCFGDICYYGLQVLPGKDDDISEVFSHMNTIINEAKRHQRKPGEFLPEWAYTDWKVLLLCVDERMEAGHIRDVIVTYFGGDSDTREFQWINVRLVIIEEYEIFAKAKDAIERDYGEISEGIPEFIDSMSHEGERNRMHEVLMKQYMRDLDNYYNGLYEVAFPDKVSSLRSSNMERGIGYFDEPFRRTDKKIGRNAPCPCGSGKKYKYCHGRKRE